MKAICKNKYIIGIIILGVVLIASVIGLCFISSNNISYAETTSITSKATALHSDYYYDNDNGKYATSNSIKHNEWSHFFDLSLVNNGRYTQSGSTFTVLDSYPMALSLSGTQNYFSIHNDGKNDGNDGMHHYSYDSNGYVNDWLVGSGRIVFEYYNNDNSITYRVISEGLWDRDLSVPIEFPLKYHNNIKVRVKLCYELWKYENGKKRYWNITQWSEPFYLRTSVLLCNSTVSSEKGSYPVFDSDKNNSVCAVEKPVYIKGVNHSTTENPTIRVEIQSDYFSMPVGASFYSNSTTSSWGVGGFYKRIECWWYSLGEGSYITINGSKTELAPNGTDLVRNKANLIYNSEGIYTLQFESISSRINDIVLHINLKYHYTSDKTSWWGASLTKEKSVEKNFSIEYKTNLYLFVSNINEDTVFFYDDIALNNNYSQASLVMDEMVRSNNTLGIVSTSTINQFTINVEKFDNNAWRQATKSEYSDSIISRTVNHKLVFNTVEPIEKFRVTVKDNKGNTNSRTFYIISNIDQSVDLKLTNEQYNSINNLPWVKTLEDHQVSCAFPELLHFDAVTDMIKVPLEKGGEKIVKKITVGRQINGSYVGDYHELLYEFYIGEVPAPRLNSIKFSAVNYHILPHSYSVQENGYVYAFKELEEAKSFVAQIIKHNYTPAPTLSAAIVDKKQFDSEIISRIDINNSQWELIARANGDIDKIIVATNAQAPLGEKVYIYNDDFFVLSKTDTIKIYFSSSFGNLKSEYLSNKTLTGKMIANSCGYATNISVTEQYYDGTSYTYDVVVLNGIRPALKQNMEV